MQRRTLLKSGLIVSALTSTLSSQENSALEMELTDDLPRSFRKPLFIATWPFGKPACEKSLDVLNGGGSILDAVERGINVTELDPAVNSVGYGGLPNANGVVQLDASFMDGAAQRAGAVAALEEFANPISVARRVMESTRHVMLAGADAGKFAEANGFMRQSLLTKKSQAAWRRWQAKQQTGQAAAEPSHDTISLLGIDGKAHLCGGCSTSGLAYKLPGRIGDSPLIGGGLYVDGKIGAAGATGVGENILRYCGSFLIVEFMRQGMSPTEACVATIERIASGEDIPAEELSVNFVALNRAGHFGGAGTDQGFRFAVVDATRSLLVKPRLVR